MTKFLYASTRNGDMRWLVGMDILDPFFLLEKNDQKYIFLDHREIGVFKLKNKNTKISVLPLEEIIAEAQKNNDQTKISNKIAFYLLEKYAVNEEIEIQTVFPLEMADYLRTKNVKLKIKEPFLPERLQKSTEEKNIIRENLRKTQKAFLRIEEILGKSKIENDLLIFENKPLTSEILKRESEMILLNEGMIDIEGMIISCGEHSAMPHHKGEGVIRPHQTIVCDIFPQHRDSAYFADMTRTYVKGQPSEELQKLYLVVAAAQELAISLVKPGRKIADLHRQVQQFFVEKGFHIGEQGFTHGTGHGLGIEIHELPYVNAADENAILQVGNVVTIEPGLYYEKLGGVRIEDVVYVTEKDCENLTDYPRRFIID